MVAKKKGLYLGLLLLLFGIGNVMQASSKYLYIKNNTLYRVTYKVSLFGAPSSCSALEGGINSGDTSFELVGGIIPCAVKKVEAKVYYRGPQLSRIIKTKSFFGSRVGSAQTVRLIVERSSDSDEDPEYKVIEESR